MDTTAIAALPVPLDQAGTQILGADGVLATHLPGYEARSAQVLMTNLAGRAILEQKQALIEAGTGSGKSFAYLVPAILSGQKVIVSTDTIALQGQLINKDLPFLAQTLEPILGRKITYAIAKGRGNYFCQRNTQALLEEKAVLQESWDQDLGQLAIKEAATAFQKGDWDGDKATLKIKMPDNRWVVIAGEESCTGK